MPRSYGTTNVMPYASAPTVGPTGDEYWNTTTKQLNLSDGTVWIPITGGGGGGGTPAWVGTITSPAANTTYTLTHNLNTSTPFVQLWDAVTLALILGQVVAVNANQIQVRFSATPANNVTVVIGGISGTSTPSSTGPWTGTITTPAANTNYTLTHNLGTTTPIVQMYDAVTLTQIVGQITATSANVVTVSFAQAPPNNVTVVISTGGIPAAGTTPTGPWTGTIVAPAANTTYTLTHSLNTLVPIVQLWDAVTHMLIQAQVIALDNNRISVYFAAGTPPNNVNVVVSTGGGLPGPTAANTYYLTYSQTVPALQVGAPYTVNHRLNSTNIVVQLWDSVTLQMVQAQVTIIDANNIRLTTAQNMPNAVNCIVMIGPTTPAAVNPSDMASKSYVDAYTLDKGQIGAAVDLNTITTPGNYRAADTNVNAPPIPTGTYLLEVQTVNSVSAIQQRATLISNPAYIATRESTSTGVWGAWHSPAAGMIHQSFGPAVQMTTTGTIWTPTTPQVVLGRRYRITLWINMTNNTGATLSWAYYVITDSMGIANAIPGGGRIMWIAQGVLTAQTWNGSASHSWIPTATGTPTFTISNNAAASAITLPANAQEFTLEDMGTG